MKKEEIIKVIISALLLIVIMFVYINNEQYKEKKVLKKQTVENIKFEKNKINIYMFWGDGCPHCEELAKYLYKLNKVYGKSYNLYTLEVWHNNKNNNLMNQFASTKNEKVSGVPYLVIGNKTFIGYSEKQNKKIEAAIKKEIKNKNHTDIYKSILEAEK